MKYFCHAAFMLALIGTTGAMAQNNITIAGAGYLNPAISIAPGQLATLFFTGSSIVLSGSRTQWASTIPLPTSLAGFSVSVSQTGSRTAIEQAPLLSVQQTNLCGTEPPPSESCILTAISAQMPSDLAVNTGQACPTCGVSTTISILENGNQGASFVAAALPQNIHILTTCDTIISNSTPNSCQDLITHANGSAVSASQPATAGETLVMYAVGLGATSPVVPSGTATPSPAPTANGPFSMQFAYNGGTALLPSSSPVLQSPISFAGMTPTAVGLYQVNFIVPQPPANTSSCQQNQNQTNLTIGLSASASSDSAKICVNTP
ncbi:MAG TPA: hypothetical protein VG297_10505 [Bryobacteraceae bacterium]|jgi:uncharacterized protein (TIGR03437 family)|nr:hypothetical protein [Bryobacteraceae bacterium]